MPICANNTNKSGYYNHAYALVSRLPLLFPPACHNVKCFVASRFVAQMTWTRGEGADPPPLSPGYAPWNLYVVTGYCACRSSIVRFVVTNGDEKTLSSSHTSLHTGPVPRGAWPPLNMLGSPNLQAYSFEDSSFCA